jgi:hypothetical protein
MSTPSLNNDDILNFILKKCQEPDIDNKKVIYLFLRSYINALIKTYNNTKNSEYAIDCADVCINIFNIIYNFTHNVRVSIYLVERSIALFNEYLTVSESISSIEVHTSEIKTFIIHKTIGGIRLNQKLHNDQNNISIVMDINILSVISNFLKQIFLKLININDITLQNENPLLNSVVSEDSSIIDIVGTSPSNYNINTVDPLQYHLEQTMLILHPIIYRLSYVGLNIPLEIELSNFIENCSDNIVVYPRYVNTFRFRMELFLYIEQICKDIEKSKLLACETIDKFINRLEDDNSLDNYLDYTQPIKNDEHLKIMREHVSNILQS